MKLKMLMMEMVKKTAKMKTPAKKMVKRTAKIESEKEEKRHGGQLNWIILAGAHVSHWGSQMAACMSEPWARTAGGSSSRSAEL